MFDCLRGNAVFVSEPPGSGVLVPRAAITARVTFFGAMINVKKNCLLFCSLFVASVRPLCPDGKS